jgi:arylsulfatase A-like enzyme
MARPAGSFAPVSGALLALLLAGCGGLDSARGYNVLLVTIDALRVPNLGAYGYDRETSPQIDALAREGTLFEAAFSPAPWTVPALGSLLTSTYPHQHLAHMHRRPRGKLGLAALREDTTTLAETLRGQGYATAMFFESAYPLVELGLGRGFAFQHEMRPESTEAIRAWLQAQGERPFFLWIHFFKPHIPYFPSARSDGLLQPERLQDHRALAEFWPSAECARRYAARDAEQLRIRVGFYDEAIRDSDFLLGEVMEELRRTRLAEKTIVAITSDHGEEFFEHGGCDHGHTLYDELLHVPLVLWQPRVLPAGRSVAGQVRTLDLAATLLELLEIERPPGFAGQSLVASLRGEELDLPAFGGFLMDGEPAFSLREGGFKYVHRPSTGSDELYDLRADPGEATNLVASQFHPRLRELREKARLWISAGPDGPAPRALRLDPAQRERLRALGYVIDPE